MQLPSSERACAAPQRCLTCHPIQPQTWDAARALLTLDFPPGRATLASVQNFQLAPVENVEDGVVMVHGLMGCAESGLGLLTSLPLGHSSVCRFRPFANERHVCVGVFIAASPILSRPCDQPRHPF